MPVVTAAIRASIGLPLASTLPSAAAAVLVATAGWWWIIARRGGVTWGFALPAAATGWLLVLRMAQTLVASSPDGLASVGGGDFGNHLHLASQFADQMPSVYLGFTAWHAATWAIATTAQLPMLDAAAAALHLGPAAAWLAAAGWVVALGHGGRRGGAGWAGALIAGACLWAVAEGWGLALQHYLGAEGFVGQAYAMLPLQGTVALVVAARTTTGRAVAATLGVGLMRYTYGLELPHMTLAAAALWAAAAASIRAGRATTSGAAEDRGAALPRWLAARPALRRWLAWAMAAALVGATFLLAARLAPAWAQTGSVRHPTLLGRLLALTIGVGAAMALWAWSGRRLRAAALWLVTAGCVGAGLVAAHLLWPALPRQYYLWKHGMLLELLGLCAAAAAAGAALAARLDTRAASPWTMVGRAAPWLRDGLALATLALALAAPLRVARSNEWIWLSYLERRGDRPWAMLEPLGDPSLHSLTAALRAEGWRVSALLHPRWAVCNAALSLDHGFAPIAPQPEGRLHDQRWAVFTATPPPTPGACVVFAAAPHRLDAWAQHDRFHGGDLGGRVLDWALVADACVDGPAMAQGEAAERACAVCTPGEGAPAHPPPGVRAHVR